MNSPLKQNTSIIQYLLNKISAIPDKDGGVILPDLTNEGSASDLLSGKQLIDGEGKIVNGSIQTKTSSDLTSSGDTVTVPAGYYASDAAKSVSTVTQATPSITVDANGKITATATQTAGYVSDGTKSATKQLTTQAAKTITPSTSSQTAVTSGVYTTGAVTVGAIPSTYIKPTATKGATTYTPTTSSQTIAAGTYCSGAQTIQGDSNLVADNIKNGVSIFGINGTYEGSGVYFEDDLICGSLSAYTNNRVTTIGSHAFTDCYSLTSVSFPAATTIGSYAFYRCSSLASVNFPVATTIYSYAFNGCYSLTSVNFPAATTIYNGAFSYCSKLTTVSFPAATTIYGYVFYYCTKLSSIYLNGSSLCSLLSSYAFSYAGIGNNKGSIFVPASLVDSYKSATNWAYFSNRIFGIDSSDSGSGGGSGGQ